MKSFIAEFIGTFILVLFACGTAVIAGSQVGVLGIALAFGLALIAAAYGIGAISGCHINPAVSLGALVAGRMNGTQFAGYVIAQCLGAIVAAYVLAHLAAGAVAGYDLRPMAWPRTAGARATAAATPKAQRSCSKQWRPSSSCW